MTDRAFFNSRMLDAIGRGDTVGVRRELENGADPDAADKDGRTGLMLVAARDMSNVYRAQIVALLLDNGADPAKADARGVTAIHAAAVAGRSDVIEKLVAAGANINAQSKTGWTPLHAAVSVAVGTGRTEMVEFLLKNGINSLYRDTQQRTAQDIALQSKGIYASNVASLLQGWEDRKPEEKRKAEFEEAMRPAASSARVKAVDDLRRQRAENGARLKLKP